MADVTSHFSKEIRSKKFIFACDILDYYFEKWKMLGLENMKLSSFYKFLQETFESEAIASVMHSSRLGKMYYDKSCVDAETASTKMWIVQNEEWGRYGETGSMA